MSVVSKTRGRLRFWCARGKVACDLSICREVCCSASFLRITWLEPGPPQSFALRQGGSDTMPQLASNTGRHFWGKTWIKKNYCKNAYKPAWTSTGRHPCFPPPVNILFNSSFLTLSLSLSLFWSFANPLRLQPAFHPWSKQCCATQCRPLHLNKKGWVSLSRSRSSAKDVWCFF